MAAEINAMRTAHCYLRDATASLAISEIHLSAALHRIDEYCRSQIKYCEHAEKAVRVFEEIRQMMPDEMWEC